LRSARFVLLLIAFGCNFAGFFIYIVSAPAFGYRILRIEQTEFVWIFGPTIIGMILGAVIARRLAGRLTPVATVFCGYAFMVGAAVFNVAYHLSNPATLPVSVLPIFVYTFGLGIATPSVTLLVLDLMPDRKGLASSMMGFSQSGSSAILAGVISHLVYDSARSLALCSLVLVVIGVLCWMAFLARFAFRLKRARA
jgi:DHA1 family bicyclomycin/chloramphenicol resistance-like MFS transporter